MITNIKIENFQNHKKTILELDKGINAIIGKSDSGKTAIVRALNWLLTNRPTGDSFINHDSSNVSVSININNHNILRERKNNKNIYKIDKEIYKAFGADVPDDVNKITNFDKINIQYQLDAPFLLSLSPRQISAYINKIVKLDKIDEVLQKAEKIKRYHKNECNQLEKETEELSKKVDNLNWIFKAKKEFHKLLKKQEVYEKEKEKYEILLTSINYIKEIDKEIKEINNKIKLENKINKLLNKIDNYNELKLEYNNLHSNLKEIKKIDLKLNEIDEEIKENEKNYKKLMPNICPLCGQGIKQ